MINKKTSALILTLLLLFQPILAAQADSHTHTTQHTALAPQKLLFVGNSFTYYNNSVHYHVEQLVKTTMPWKVFKDYNFRMSTTSGAFMREHKAGLTSLTHGKQWNAVVIQGHSTEAITPKLTASFRKATEQLINIIRKNDAKPVLFMTWAYSTNPKMTDALDKAYTEIGNELDTLVVPVGLAFRNALAARPELNLHAKDTKHPSIAGTYLAASTFYAALYGKSPVGNRYIIDGLDKSDAKFLQTIAWQTVQSYYKRAQTKTAKTAKTVKTQ